MKKTLLTILSICCALTITAQSNKLLSHEEYCQQLQTFITERAELTPDEAKEFFPIYFELQKDKWKINKEARNKFKKEKGEKLTDDEYIELINEMADAKIKIAILEKNYLEKYLKIIPARKIRKVQYAEDRFQREMIKNMARGNKHKKKNN